MKKRLTIVILLILTIIMSIPVNAAGNNWVLDEPELISAETEKYIKTVNEEVFTTYKNKPQFAVIMLNELPEGYTIDEYKLEQFNELGVGTKEENCGMLFVFVIKARQYGFEIGDGFEKGSLVRKELEKDFITPEMKNLLREGDYDAVVLQITKHIEQVMEDDKTGVLAKKDREEKKKEKEREQAAIKQIENAEKAMVKTAKVVGIGLVGFFVIGLFVALSKRAVKKAKVNKLLFQHQRYVTFMQVGEEEKKELRKFLVNDTSNFVGIGYLFKKQSDLPETNDSFIEALHEYYLDKEIEKLKDKTLGYDFRLYENHLRKENNVKAFKEFRTKGIFSIICEVDREMEKIQQIKEQNYEKIDSFVESKKDEVPNGELSLETLAKNIKGHCETGVLMDDETLEEVFVKELNELSFQYAYEKFIAENKGKINNEYFDDTKFYKSLHEREEYGKHRYDRDDDFSWALPLLIMHMNNREREIRRDNEYAAEQARQMMQSSSSSFGSSFGGGHSSGGGFSGGW